MSRQEKIQKVLQLQQLLQAEDITSITVTKDTGVNRMTISNLKNEKVDPEKMTDEILDKLAAFMDKVNESASSDVREKNFGELLAVMQEFPAVANTTTAFSKFSRDPATVTQHLLELNINTAAYKTWEQDITAIMASFDPDDFDDRPLTGKYLLYYHRKRGDIARYKESLQ